MNVRRWTAALAIFAMVAGGIGIAAAVIFADRPPAPTLAKAPPSVPTPSEFTIGVVVTEQNCSPSGGCLYKYTIEPKYVGLHPLPETPFTVEYEVTGRHQPQSGNFTVQNGQAKIFKDVTLEGPAGARLHAAVTQVIG